MQRNNSMCYQGRIFLMTEAISQFCRGLAPIQPWLVFLLDSYSGSEKVCVFAFLWVRSIAITVQSN